MKDVIIIQKINTCGMPVGLNIKESGSPNKISRITKESLRVLEKAFRLEKKEIDETKELYVYHASQPSSGYKTSIKVNKEDEFVVDVTRPEGMVMSAFFTDIIVFQK